MCPLFHPSCPHSLPQYGVVITTPDVVLIDAHFLAEFQWRALVIDEAHRLKNPTRYAAVGCHFHPPDINALTL